MAQWRLRSERQLSRETISALEGRLCLGLANTFHPRFGRHVHDALTGYPDLVIWNRSLGMLTDEQAQYHLKVAQRRPQEAHNAFERAIVLREATFRVFSAVAARGAPQSEDLDVIRDTFAEAMAHASLSPDTHEFTWEWSAGEGHEENLNLLLWPVAHSAIELFTAPEELRRAKECPGCGWLFLDTSKIGNRRWCSMDACGSRDKMRRQYARKRAQRHPSSNAPSRMSLSGSPLLVGEGPGVRSEDDSHTSFSNSVQKKI